MAIPKYTILALVCLSFISLYSMEEAREGFCRFVTDTNLGDIVVLERDSDPIGIEEDSIPIWGEYLSEYAKHKFFSYLQRESSYSELNLYNHNELGSVFQTVCASYPSMYEHLKKDLGLILLERFVGAVKKFEEYSYQIRQMEKNPDREFIPDKGFIKEAERLKGRVKECRDQVREIKEKISHENCCQIALAILEEYDLHLRLRYNMNAALKFNKLKECLVNKCANQ